MEHFAGLDVSVKETSVCIVDDTGRIMREVKVASEPEDLLKVLGNPAYCCRRIDPDLAHCAAPFWFLARQHRHFAIISGALKSQAAQGRPR
jgi:predicted NBD/HSP70 family sugar kinase